ncbi:MAG: chlorhexidine efflux transporter [Sneathiella sp.]
MRTFWDRIRHTILFELIAVLSVAFVGGWILDQPIETMGFLSVIMSILAMSWNFT